MSEVKKRVDLPLATDSTSGCGSAEEPTSGMDRRTALKVIAAAAAAPTVFTACDDAPDVPGAGGEIARAPTPTGNPLAAGTAWDPDLVSPVVPWEKVLTEAELVTLAALCDVIIPADDVSPAASSVGAHDFIDEWVSAPIDAMQRDRVTVRGGIVWIDREAASRFGGGSGFADLTRDQKHAICDDIAYEPNAAPEHKAAARFFDLVRRLTATAFYTTREGMDDLGYVGNTPLAQWDPPPPEALRHVGLE